MREFGEVTDSPSPVMTFQAAGANLAVPVVKMDHIAFAEWLWPVPLAWPLYAGLMDDNGELVPVLRLTRDASHTNAQLVAVLHVRGEAVGLAIDAVGRVLDRYRTLAAYTRVPRNIADLGATHAQVGNETFWLIDPDRLWPSAGGAADPLTPNV